ncbi:hypothetical protein [Porcipelethomonas sp.]|uniref:hypothetical protein n=1 Tax=Porcipelethomonas sp. TaxID=2981675 RepID=UPI003EF6C5AE
MKSGVTSNIWLKRIASVFSLIYAVYICVLAFRSVFYDVIIKKPVVFCVYLSAISAAALVIMIYSRKQLATKLASLILIPALLPIILMCLGSWEMIIPLAICAVTIFFASGANEGTKTLLGTVYLLIYILAALAYFIFTSYLTSPAVQKTIEEGVSPSEKYRYEVINTTDSSGGCTTVMLEPNDKDIVRSSVTYKAKGYDRKLCVKRPLTEVKIEWKDDDLYINGERWFTPEQAQKGKCFEKESFF